MKQRVIDRMLIQDAVYWGSPTVNGYGGYTYASPVAVRVRWMDRQEKIIKENAEDIISQAVVLCNVPLQVKGMLALMSLSDLNSSGLPEDETAFEIKHVQRRKSLKDNTFVNKALL